MNESWFKDLANRAMAMTAYHDPRFPPSPYYRFLAVLAQNMQPTLSVELGVDGGGGSFHLALGWAAGTVVGVDRKKGSEFVQENWRFMQEYLSNFTLWKGDSIESAPDIVKEWGRVDILFIDTVHTYERTMAEFNAWEPFLSDGAVVCLDDLRRPGMQDAWDEVPGHKLRLDFLHDGAEFGGGFGVVWGGWGA